MRRLLLLRPEPGLKASRQRAEAMGLEVVACPLFEVVPLTWTAPDACHFDGLLLTSANAVRQAGAGLEGYRHLPTYAVGRSTAAAAEATGLEVLVVGSAGAEGLLAELPPTLRLLHLAGRHRAGTGSVQRITSVPVYDARQVENPPLPNMENMVVAVHSPRAGARIAELVERRADSRIVAISDAAAAACGEGWNAVAVPDEPDDAQLLALAAKLCQTGGA